MEFEPDSVRGIAQWLGSLKIAGYSSCPIGDGNGNYVTKGFYPSDPGLKRLVGPGEVRDDSNYKNTGSEHPYDWSKTIYVSEQQCVAMRDYIQRVESWNSDQYGLLENNCAGFVKDVLSAGRVSYPHSGIHPISTTIDPAIALLLDFWGGIGDLLNPIDDRAARITHDFQ